MEHEGTLHSFEIMGNTNVMTKRHIQDALNPQQHHCGNLKSCKLSCNFVDRNKHL